MNDNFLCKCGHRNKMHSTVEDSMKFYKHSYRVCFEYANFDERIRGVIDSWNKETLCTCSNFTPDNLATLELLSNVK